MACLHRSHPARVEQITGASYIRRKKMEQICPIMSRPVATKGEYDNPRIDVTFVNCQKEICALWSEVYTTEKTRQTGCSLELNAHKNSEGLYVV